MKRNVEVSDIDTGIKIIVSANNPEEIQKIKGLKEWYTDVVRDHENINEHGSKHHLTHHEEGHGSEHKKHP